MGGSDCPGALPGVWAPGFLTPGPESPPRCRHQSEFFDGNPPTAEGPRSPACAAGPLPPAGLGNLGPLLAVPGLIGLGIVSLVSWKTTGKPGKRPSIALAVLCWLLALATLPVGIAGLLSNFGG